MAYTIYYSNPLLTTKAGFGGVAHFPCIIDSRPGYHRLGNNYLIDRGIALWNPSRDNTHRFVLTPQSLKNYAYSLVNFLEWTDARGVDILKCNYLEHVYGRYQSDLLSGKWSRDGIPLSAQTVNLRVQQACDFLSWLHDKGHREYFDIPFRLVKIKGGSATDSKGHLAREIAIRKGKVRQNKRRLRIPTTAQVQTWLKAVYELNGETEGLMCETILCTGMRREEVASLRASFLPQDIENWHLSNNVSEAHQQVLIEIKHGTKGPFYGWENGDKIGPSRSIWIPLHLAKRLHAYRVNVRTRAIQSLLRTAENFHQQQQMLKEQNHLFVDLATGKRMTSRKLYDAWSSAPLPFIGWSPHLGRDWWACSILWQEMQKHDHLKSLGKNIAAALIENTAMSIIRLQIQPQLGHSHDSTSMIYLFWVQEMLGGSVAQQYFPDEGA